MDKVLDTYKNLAIAVSAVVYDAAVYGVRIHRLDDVYAALDKLAEELGELQSAVADDTNIKEELGDLLFAAVKVARFFHIDPEEALEGTCEKFIRRFSAVEAAVTAQGQDMKDVDVSQLMVYWNRAKHPAKDEIEETEEEKGQST